MTETETHVVLNKKVCLLILQALHASKTDRRQHLNFTTVKLLKAKNWILGVYIYLLVVIYRVEIIHGLYFLDMPNPTGLCFERLLLNSCRQHIKKKHDCWKYALLLKAMNFVVWINATECVWEWLLFSFSAILSSVPFSIIFNVQYINFSYVWWPLLSTQYHCLLLRGDAVVISAG